MEKENVPVSLGTENVGKLLIKYAIPAIIAMVASSLYSITDSIFIGHGVGALALSGLAITFPLMNLGAAFGAMVGVGASTLLSIRLGQKDYVSANYILGNVIVLNLIIGSFFSAIALIFLNPILILFGASADTLPFAYDYMFIILCGNVFIHLFFGLNAMLRAAGNPHKAMMATVYSVLINLILDPLFIFGFGWGMRGSAIATVISIVVVLVWQINIFCDKNYFIHFKRGIYRLQRKIVSNALSIGLAPFLMNAAGCVIVILINRNMIHHGGDLAVGAYGIVNRVAFPLAMVVLGLTQAMQPIVGYNFGARLHRRVTEALKITILWATVVMILGFVVVELFPRSVASIFTSDKELIDLSTTGLRIVFLVFPVVGLQIVTSSFFQSLGMAKKAIFLSLTRQVLFLIPCLLILPHFWGLNGVWISLPISDFVSTIMAAVMLASQFRQFREKITST